MALCASNSHEHSHIFTGRFIVHRITPEEASYKLLKVRKVQLGAKGVPHVVTHDGRTLRYPDPLVRVNDVIRFDFENNKQLDFIKFETGVQVMITGGRNQGRVGVVTGVEKHPGGFDIVHVLDPLGHAFSTRLSNSFAIGEGNGAKPVITLPRGGGVKLTIAEERDQRRRQKDAQA